MSNAPIIIERTKYKGEIDLKFYETSHRYKIKDNTTGEERWADMSPSKALQVIDKPGLKFWAANLGRDHCLTILKEKGYVTEADIIEGARLHTVRTQEGKTEGKIVHEWIKDYAKWDMAGRNGDQPALPEGETTQATKRIQNAIIAVLGLFQDEEIHFVLSEEPVYSRELDIPGTLDLVFTCKRTDHKLQHLLDFKTGKPRELKEQKPPYNVIGYAPYNEHRYQTACYLSAVIEEAVYSLGEKKAPKFGDRLVAYLGKEDAEFTPFWIPADTLAADFEGFKNAASLSRREAAIDAENMANPPLVA